VRPAEPRTRVNETIRVPQVRLIDDDGSQIGVKARDEALEYAWAKNLDLVEVAPDANPPVCRVMDYGKYRYDQEQKQKLARKHQSTITIKEIKLRPKIDPHDYATKKGHVVRFLRQRDKVKVTIMFRGREMSHPERGRSLLERLAEDVSELGVIESAPIQDGRNMVMLLAPVREIADAKPEPAAKPDKHEAKSEAKPATEPAAAVPETTPEATPAASEPEAAPEEPDTKPEAAPEAVTEAKPAAAPKAKATKPKATAEAKPATPRKKPVAKAKPAEQPPDEPAQDAEPAAAAPEPTSS
jgi:translation initiation factor IF-3